MTIFSETVRAELVVEAPTAAALRLGSGRTAVILYFDQSNSLNEEMLFVLQEE
jgi:hypothetical protein